MTVVYIQRSESFIDTRQRIMYFMFLFQSLTWTVIFLIVYDGIEMLFC